MNWNHFLIALGAAYFFYYALLIAIDLAAKLRVSKEQPDLRELIFQHEDSPREITAADLAAPADVGSQPNGRVAGALPQGSPSSGGHSIASLIDQARTDVGEYTSRIPY